MAKAKELEQRQATPRGKHCGFIGGSGRTTGANIAGERARHLLAAVEGSHLEHSPAACCRMTLDPARRRCERAIRLRSSESSPPASGGAKDGFAATAALRESSGAIRSTAACKLPMQASRQNPFRPPDAGGDDQELRTANCPFAATPRRIKRHPTTCRPRECLQMRSLQTAASKCRARFPGDVGPGCPTGPTMNPQCPPPRCLPLLQFFGLRHSYTDGRSVGYGWPMVGTSWLNRRTMSAERSACLESRSCRPARSRKTWIRSAVSLSAGTTTITGDRAAA